jgi:hypothetical protein
MTYTPIPAGTIDWDVPLNAALVDQDNRITANTADIVALQGEVDGNLDNLVYLVDNHGAVGNGTNNDQPAIQALINSVPIGSTIKFGAKRYGVSSTLTLPPYIRLEGALLDRDGDDAVQPAIVPLAGFSSSAVFTMVDQATGGYSTVTRNITLSNLSVDGVNLTSETVSAISATGLVHSTQLYNISIHAMTDHSITMASNGSGNPYSWYMSNVHILGEGSVTTWNGFNLIGTDHQMSNCRTLGVRGHGYVFTGGANIQLVNCRSEWSALSGFYITGSWGTGQGSGGILMSNCSTDRNSQYGILIDSTGNASHMISGVMLRRDGRNGFPGTGGGSFAGLRVSSATTPVIVSGITVYPGVNDDGTGVNSPERGTSVANSTYVSINDGYLHADTTPFHDGSGNTALYRGPLVGTATGTTAAPTRSLVGANSMPGPFTLTQGGYQAIRGSGTTTLLDGRVTADSAARLNVNANGLMLWGSGAGAGDVNLQRSGVGALSTNGSLTASGLVTAGTGATRLPTGDFSPQDHGLESWTHDPFAAASSASAVNGTMYVVKLMVRRAVTIDTLWWVVSTGATTPTAAQNWIGLYNSSGTKLTDTDISTASGSGGTKSTAITAQVLSPGFYWVAFLFNAATPPVLLRGSSFESSPSINLGTSALRSAVAGTALTTLPASFTPGSLTTTGNLTLFSAASE